jgi:hypothetical protein
LEYPQDGSDEEDDTEDEFDEGNDGVRGIVLELETKDLHFFLEGVELSLELCEFVIDLPSRAPSIEPSAFRVGCMLFIVFLNVFSLFDHRVDCSGQRGLSLGHLIALPWLRSISEIIDHVKRQSEKTHSTTDNHTDPTKEGHYGNDIHCEGRLNFQCYISIRLTRQPIIEIPS